ncbi:hypothetical protein GT93_00855 [Pseudomonas plecoglossicida]|nr:hypothetical protein GT93_00855 [Pseudomonas plecoglossicida]
MSTIINTGQESEIWALHSAHLLGTSIERHTTFLQFRQHRLNQRDDFADYWSSHQLILLTSLSTLQLQIQKIVT